MLFLYKGVFLLLAGFPARAALPAGSEVVVSSPVLLGAKPLDLLESLPDGAGGVYVVWLDRHTGGFQVYAQRLDSEGRARWGGGSPLPLTALPGSDREKPRLLRTPAGLLVAWLDHRRVGRFGGAGEVYAQTVRPEGVPGWAAGGLKISQGRGTQDFLLAKAGAGLVLCALEGRSEETWTVRLRRYALSGAPQEPPWEGGRIPPRRGGGKRIAGGFAAGSEAGAFFFLSSVPPGGGDDLDLFLLRVPASGRPEGPITLASGPGDQGRAVSAAPDGEGGAYVAWTETASGAAPGGRSARDLYALRLGPDGRPRPGWEPRGTRLTEGRTVLEPRLAGAGPRGSWVGWLDGPEGRPEAPGQARLLYVPGTGRRSEAFPAEGRVVGVTHDVPALAVSGERAYVAWIHRDSGGISLRLQSFGSAQHPVPELGRDGSVVPWTGSGGYLQVLAQPGAGGGAFLVRLNGAITAWRVPGPS